MARTLRDFYIYQANFDAIEPNETKTVNISIQADSSFEIQKLTYFAQIAGQGFLHDQRIIPYINVMILDTGSGRQLMDQATPLPNFFGTGQIPFILQEPKIFSARSTVQITCTSYDPDNTYSNVRLSFIGAKLFKVND